MTSRRSGRTGIEQLPRSRGEGRRGAGDGSAGPTTTSAMAGTTTGSRRSGRVEHSEGGYPPTATAEAQTGAASRGCSDFADVFGDGLLLLLLLLLLLMER